MISAAYRHWMQLILATIGLTAFLITLVAAAYIHNVRFDLSPGNRFTLSDHAHQVLDKVSQPIKILSFIRTEDPRNPYIKDLLWQVSREQPLITYDIVDVNRNPALAAQYGVSTYGSTVVESGTKRSDFSNPTESLLMSAILRVMQDSKRVYALTGHGECSIENTDRNIGCSLLREALSMEGYQVDPLAIVGGNELPEDADILVIPGPKTDLLEPEAHAIGRWLDGGGKIFVMLDPFRAPRLMALLGQYGIEVGNNIVLDAGNRMAGGEQFSLAVTDINRQHLISSTLKSPPLFSLAAVVTARAEEESPRVAETLLKTGPRSWASYDPGILEGGEARFVAGRDINGPLPVGVAVTEPAAAAKDKGVETRLVVVGDSDFAGNRFLDYLGNKDLLVNSVNWLAREDALMGTRPQRKVGGKNQLFVSQEDAEGVFWYAVVVQPGLFLLVGIALFVYRRFGP